MLEGNAIQGNVRPPVLLIHGAWHDRRCWEPLQMVLSNRGLRSTAIDLPGHGPNPDPAWLTGWSGYLRGATEALCAFPEPPVVVAHSMGGMVAAALAERMPERINSIVYLAAWVPRTGESFLKLVGRGSTPDGLRFNLMRGVATIEPRAAESLFYADCADPAALAARLQPQPFRTFFAKTSLTRERFGSVRSVYLRTLADQAIPPALQSEMARDAGAAQVIDVDAGHFAFLAQPEKIAALIGSFVHSGTGR